MAYVKLAKDGYGQVELNQVAFRRDGRIEAQCALDATEYTNATDVAENGMLFVVDKKNRKLVKATQAKIAITKTSGDTTTTVGEKVVGLNYSSEHIYDERTPGLKNFALRPGEFLPRIGFFAVGDRIHTNTVCFQDTTYANEAAWKALFTGNASTSTPAAPVYAAAATDNSVAGYWELITDIDGVVGPIAEVVEWATMPDGQVGLKLEIIKA